MSEATLAPRARTLVELPAELVLDILVHLEPLDLASVARTCKALSTHSYDDRIWQPLINRNLHNPLTEPAPLKTFRELYIAHHPYWFLAKYRLWFSDGDHQGKLVAARYEPQRGCIAAYTVAAQRGRHTLEFWEKDREVIIHSFNPKIILDLGKPVLNLDVDSLRTNHQPDNEPSDRAYAPPSNYSKEILMETSTEAGLYSSFMLCRTLPERAIGEGTAVWPPSRLPTPTRVRNDTRDGYQSSGHRPTRLDDVSEYHWRLRKWVEFAGRRTAPRVVEISSVAFGWGGPYFEGRLSSSGGDGMSIRMPEDVTTFAALPQHCFEPTSRKPWQGLWCGDYSGHGCEFMVVIQPDKEDEQPLPEGTEWLRQWFRGGRRGSESSASSYASAQEEIPTIAETIHEQLNQVTTWMEQDQRHIVPHAVLAGFTEMPYQRIVEEITDYNDVPSGRLEAIKLTGDPNIPRGEYTFIAPDIGHGGFLRVADEEIFKGARIVRSAGHIAGRGFREDQYTPSQLIMISHDRLAQFWEGFGHISYYQRVDLDALMKYTG